MIRYYRKITENELTLPTGDIIRYDHKTLEKWEAYYRKSGMDGLMPKKRSDTGLNGFDPSEVSSLEELNRLLADYVRKRNTTINKTINETPMERYQRGMGHIRLPKSNEWLSECFMNRITRKVNLDATISIDSVSYDVPMQFIRSKVQIRFLPDQMQDAYIYFEGINYPIRPTNRVENGCTKRNNTHAIDYSKMGDANHV